MKGLQFILFYIFQSIHAMKDICAKADVPMSKASLSWVLQQFDKSCVIVGCRTPEQVVENSKIVKLSSVSIGVLYYSCNRGGKWLGGREWLLGLNGPQFETRQRHSVVSLCQYLKLPSPGCYKSLTNLF